MYNYSARRKQGLGSLRPGYDIGGFLTGQLLNWGAPKAIDYFTKSPEQRKEEKYRRTMKNLGIQPYFPTGSDDDEDEGTIPSGKSRIGGGILNALATMILGPIMGPIAMTLGRGVMNKSKGLGFFGGGGDGGSGPGPKGLGPKTDWYTGSDEEDKDEENRIDTGETGSDAGWENTVTTSAPSHIGPTGGDIHGNGDSGGGGSDGWSGGAETRDSSGWESSPFFKGGRVSYSKGGIASLWQR